MLKYAISNTFSSVVTFLNAILSFIWQLSNPIIYPWVSAYVSSIYTEVVSLYFDKCKEDNIPYAEPPAVVLASIAAKIKGLDIKDELFSGIKERQTNFYTRLILAPFSLSDSNRKDIEVVQKNAIQHNKKITAEYSKEELTPLLEESIKMFNTTFDVEVTKK